MGKEKIVKVAGFALTIAGVGVSIATSILDDKKLDMKIAKQIEEKLKN